MSEVTEINVAIMRLLEAEGESMTPSQIVNKLPDYDEKDVKYSIRRLREKGLIKVIPNLMDMRRVFYRLANPEEIEPGKARIKERELKVFYDLSPNSHVPKMTLEDMEAAAQV